MRLGLYSNTLFFLTSMMLSHGLYAVSTPQTASTPSQTPGQNIPPNVQSTPSSRDTEKPSSFGYHTYDTGVPSTSISPSNPNQTLPAPGSLNKSRTQSPKSSMSEPNSPSMTTPNSEKEIKNPNSPNSPISIKPAILPNSTTLPNSTSPQGIPTNKSNTGF